MRRLTVAFLSIFSAAMLAACGDTGDHFFEFKKQVPPPAVVDHMALVMPLVATRKTKHASLKLYVTAYTHKSVVAQGTTLSNPIIIHSNWSGLTMLVNGKQTTAAAFGSAPGTISVTYTAPSSPCKPVVGFVAYNQSAVPQSIVIDAVKCSK